MNRVLIFFWLIFISCHLFGESIFVLGEPYYRGGTEYSEKDECVEAGECVEFAWYREYKLKRVKVLSGNLKNKKVTFVMATHSPRYTNGDKRQKWYVELVPVNHKAVEYKAIDWYPITEIVCTQKPLTNGDGDLQSWYTSQDNEPCYDLIDLIESKNISKK